ncbi:unnamed protein product [Blepharisma stoltei]|uniref:Uncharacterized protein n=1 Tax=Blepharisma stoltei TaxID=1481888 RepID=A0AAU9IVP1_9CILI|nr:unnamed protein product [Blepharisma stoltei]
MENSLDENSISISLIEGTEASPLNPSSSVSLKKDHWCLLRNVLRAVTLFRCHDVVPNQDADQVVGEIQKIPTDYEYRKAQSLRRDSSAYSVALNDLRREQRWFNCLGRGTPEDIEHLKEEIINDPYRHLRISNHPLSLLNKRNRNGMTPLYLASINGNYEVVKLLLDSGADHLITSSVDNEEVTCIEAAARLRHAKIVELLAAKQWPEKVIEKVLSDNKSQNVENIVRKCSKSKKSKKMCCFGRF